MDVKHAQPEVIIVIFGAAVLRSGQPSETLRSRVAAAMACGARWRVPLYLPTGAVGRFGGSEASVMASLLRETGVPSEHIALEETGTDTLSSVRAVVRLLRCQTPAPILSRTAGQGGVGAKLPPIHVATSGYHLPRCLLLLRLAGITAHACPPPPAAQTFRQRWRWRLREVPAIPYDAALILALRLLRRV